MGSTLNVNLEGGWMMSQCKRTNKMFFCFVLVFFLLQAELDGNGSKLPVGTRSNTRSEDL